MWILYLVVAIIMSTGAGVYVSRDTDITTQDIARIEAPKVQGDVANQMARYLRRMYQDNPGMFPSRPRAGAAPVLIPNPLVRRSLSQGHNAPDGVRFVLQSDGSIIPVFASTTSPRGDLVAQSIDSVIEREGANPDQYARLEVQNRKGHFSTATRMAPIRHTTSADLSSRDILTSGGGSDAAARAQGEQVTVPRQSYDWTDNTDNVSVGTGSGQTGGGQTGGGQTGGGQTGGGQTGGGQTGGGSGTGAQTGADIEPITGLESLEGNGGQGGSTNVNPLSYYISGGVAVVAPGFENTPTPIANFYSLNNLETAMNGSTPMVESITRLNFANEYAAMDKARIEESFDTTCRAILAQLDGNFQSDMEGYTDAVMSFYTPPTNSLRAAYEEDMEQIEASALIAGMYCMGVYNGRTANRPLPIRANGGHIRNLQALDMGTGIVTTWKNEHTNFMSAKEVPEVWRLDDRSGTYVRVRAASHQTEMAEFKKMMDNIQRLHQIVRSYPAPRG